jgi:hypothetical protein
LLAVIIYDFLRYLLPKNHLLFKKNPTAAFLRITIFLDSLHSLIGENVMAAKNVEETRVYKLAFELAMEI